MLPNYPPSSAHVNTLVGGGLAKWLLLGRGGGEGGAINAVLACALMSEDFEGIEVGVCVWVYVCVQWGIQAKWFLSIEICHPETCQK